MDVLLAVVTIDVSCSVQTRPVIGGASSGCTDYLIIRNYPDAG